MAGCESAVILDKLGLTWADLCAPREDDRRRQERAWTPNGPAIAVYTTRRERRRCCSRCCARADKKFSQRVPDRTRKSGWPCRLGDTRRVLYQLPKLIEDIADGETIWVAEGEKDVHALERAGVHGDVQSRRRREVA